MRQQLLAFAVTLFLFCPLAEALAEQVESVEVSQTEISEPPASREDLLRATESMRRQINRLEIRSAEEIEKSNAEAKRQHDELLAQGEKAKRELELALTEKANAERLMIEEREARTQKQVRLLIGAGGVLALLTLSGFLFLLSKKTKKEEIREIYINNRVNPKDERFLVHEKTDFHDLVEYVKQNNTLKTLFQSIDRVAVPCIIEIPKRGTEYDGVRLECTVFLGKSILGTNVRFDLEPELGSTWKNRFSRAVEIAKKNAITAQDNSL